MNLREHCGLLSFSKFCFIIFTAKKIFRSCQQITHLREFSAFSEKLLWTGILSYQAPKWISIPSASITGGGEARESDFQGMWWLNFTLLWPKSQNKCGPFFRLSAESLSSHIHTLSTEYADRMFIYVSLLPCSAFPVFSKENQELLAGFPFGSLFCIPPLPTAIEAPEKFSEHQSASQLEAKHVSWEAFLNIQLTAWLATNCIKKGRVIKSIFLVQFSCISLPFFSRYFFFIYSKLWSSVTAREVSSCHFQPCTKPLGYKTIKTIEV